MNINFLPLAEAHLPLMLKWLETPHIKKWWDPEITYTKQLVQEKYSCYALGYKKIASGNKPI